MKYKIGDRVRVKSLDWYNENKDENGIVLVENGDYMFCKSDIEWCGRTVTIKEICLNEYYEITEDFGKYRWTDEMIEGLVEEETKPKYEDEVNGGYYSTPKYLVRPNGYQFVDENGNVINATKIVLEKKKKEYPKSFGECCKVLGTYSHNQSIVGYKNELFSVLQKLYICRNAYWKLYGDEMGLGKPWEPSHKEPTYAICRIVGTIRTIETAGENYILEFPTEEMRDAFYENFKEEIEKCKELL